MQRVVVPIEEGRAAASARIGATQEEALARSEFLVTQRRPFGLIVGPAGTGKSEILRRLTSAHPRTARAISIEMTGQDSAGLLGELGASLAASTGAISRRDPLRNIRDRLEGLAACGDHLLLALDHLDAAWPDAFTTLAHLLRVTSGMRALTVLAACRKLSPPGLADLQRDFGWLRIELASWSAVETEQAVRGWLWRTGRREATLTSDAVHALHDACAGNPRAVERLCELALLTAEAEDSEAITGGAVRMASRELAG